MKKYAVSLLSVLLAFSVLFGILTWISGLIVSAIDDKNREKFRNNEITFNNKYESGIPVSDDVVLRQPFKLQKEKNYIVIGSSTTREGVLKDQLTLPEGYTFHNFSTPSMGINELYIMINFLNGQANHKMDKTDVVKIDIGVGFFKNRNPEESLLIQYLEKGGNYVVDRDNFTVKKSFGNRMILSAFLKTQSLINEIDILIKNEKSVTKPYSKTSYKKYKDQWTKNLYDFDLSEQEQERFFTVLEALTAQTNVVVETVYTGTWLLDTAQGKKYLNWKAEILSSRLSQMGVKCIDTTNLLPDELYAEQSHLNYEGRIKYTQLESELISQNMPE